MKKKEAKKGRKEGRKEGRKKKKGIEKLNNIEKKNIFLTLKSACAGPLGERFSLRAEQRSLASISAAPPVGALKLGEEKEEE